MCSVWQDAELSGSWTCIRLEEACAKDACYQRSDWNLEILSLRSKGHSWRSSCRNLILLLWLESYLLLHCCCESSVDA
jgi:hypothetical protein